MELFNTEFGQQTTLKGLQQISFPWQNHTWTEWENEGFSFLDKAGTALVFMLYPDPYNPGEFSILGESVGSLLIQIHIFVSPK